MFLSYLKCSFSEQAEEKVPGFFEILVVFWFSNKSQEEWLAFYFLKYLKRYLYRAFPHQYFHIVFLHGSYNMELHKLGPLLKAVRIRSVVCSSAVCRRPQSCQLLGKIDMESSITYILFPS